MEDADLEVLLEGEGRRLHHHLLDLDDRVAGVVADVARNDAPLGLEPEALAALGVRQLRAVQQHQLVRRNPLGAGVEELLDGVEEGLRRLARKAEDQLAVGLHPLGVELVLELLVRVQFDVGALDVDQYLRIHRLHGRGHRQRALHLPHHPDDALAVVLAGGGSDVARPAVVVLEPAEIVGDRFVPQVHAEVVVGEAERGLGLQSLGEVEEVRLHVLDRVGVDTAVLLHPGVAEGARERAASGDLQHREVSRRVERLHETAEIRGRDLVEVGDPIDRPTHHQLAAPAIDPGVAGKRALQRALDAEVRLEEALDQALEGALALVGGAVDVDVDHRLVAEELCLHRSRERPVGTAHDGERGRPLRLGVAGERVGELLVPGVVRETEDVGDGAIERRFEILRLAEQPHVEGTPGHVRAEVAGHVCCAQRINVGALRQEIVAEIGDEDLRHESLWEAKQYA